MKTRFRISKDDTIKATISCNYVLLNSIYDSQFTTIGEVISRLISKVPYFQSKYVEINIYNETKGQSKYITKIINK